MCKALLMHLFLPYLYKCPSLPPIYGTVESFIITNHLISVKKTKEQEIKDDEIMCNQQPISYQKEYNFLCVSY